MALHQLGIAPEVTFGTYVAPTSFVEFTSESLRRVNNTIASDGIRATTSRAVRRDARRVLVGRHGEGNINMEVQPGGIATVLEQLLGAVATTEEDTGVRYQHVATVGDLSGKSLTIQKGVERSNGTVTPFSFLGSKFTDGTFSISTDGFLLLDLSVHSRDVVTSESLATATYSTGDDAQPFHFAQAALTLDGAAVAAVSDATIQIANNLDADRRYLGNAGLIEEHTPLDFIDLSGSFTAEFDDPATIYDVFAADSKVGVVLTFTGPTLGTGNYSLEINLPAVRLDGDTPQMDSIAIPNIDASFMAYDDDSAEPITVTVNNADSSA